MNYSNASTYLQALKTYKKRLERKRKIDVTSESKLRDLLQIDRFYDAINLLSEKGDFFNVAETYQIASDLCNIAASKSENKEFNQWAKTLALLFKDKVPIEEAAINLRSATTRTLHDIKPYQGLEEVPYTLRERLSAETETIYSLDSLVKEREPPFEELMKITPISALSEVMDYKLKQVVGPTRGKALTKLLLHVLRRLDLPVKTHHALEMQIGPNTATFKPDIAIFDRSNNLKAIVETVSNLTQRRAEELSLRSLAIKEDHPEVRLFVIFIEAIPKAIKFMEPIVDGVYSVKDIEVLLKQIQT